MDKYKLLKIRYEGRMHELAQARQDLQASHDKNIHLQELINQLQEENDDLKSQLEAWEHGL